MFPTCLPNKHDYLHKKKKEKKKERKKSAKNINKILYLMQQNWDRKKTKHY